MDRRTDPVVRDAYERVLKVLEPIDRERQVRVLRAAAVLLGLEFIEPGDRRGR